MDPVNPSGAPPNPNLDALAAELTAITGAPPAGDAATSAPIPPPEPPPIEPPPEPPDPRAKRAYVNRAVNLFVGAGRLEGTFYRMADGHVNLEGTFGGQPFDTLDDAVRLAALDSDATTALLSRLHTISNQPNRFR